MTQEAEFMTVALRKGVLSFEDFCRLVRDDQKADLIAGVIYMASPDNTDANALFVWLIGLLHDFAELRDLGKVYGSRVAFRLDKRNGPEPDIGFVRKKRLHLVEKEYVNGPPDLAVEIVSPESVERDYKKKRRQYEDAGVPEYWIIDEELRRVTLLRLDQRGRYREVRLRKGAFQSRVLPGFWLRPEWLWGERRPRKVDVLKELLS
jgi:Uma2 family endonuclease